MFVFDHLVHRLKHGCETMAYPHGPAPALPDRHGGSLRVDAGKCATGCSDCLSVCPTTAITQPGPRGVSLDLGRCLFCSACVNVCPSGAITHTSTATARRAIVLRSAPRLFGRAVSLLGAVVLLGIVNLFRRGTAR